MMTTNEFIEELAKYVKKYAPQYGIRVHSPIIAQGILESAKGTSELAKYHNYFGLKYRPNRCPTATGFCEKVGSEQLKDGSYVSSPMKWFKFPNMEAGVIGYFDFINDSNYANLKGVTDPKTYLENIKADGYATSINYVSNLMRTIETYGLTKYDEEVPSMSKKIAIDAGHGLYTSGKRCDKKLDSAQTREWTLNDRIADRLEALLDAYDCEVLRTDDTTGLTDVSLKDRVNKANNWGADVLISTHHNAGLYGKLIGYLKKLAGGTVVFYYSSKAERKAQAQALYDAVVGRTGLVGDRATKVSKHPYYIIKNTKMPAFLIENGFMDSPTDVPIILSADHAEKTAQGLLDFLVKEFKLTKIKDYAGNAGDAAVSTSFKVKILDDALNIRKGPSTNYDIVGVIKDHGIYTIVETSGSWGKLKSGAGWISINNKYVSRV